MSLIFRRNISKITQQIHLHGNKISFNKNPNGLIIGSFNGEVTKENFMPNPKFLPKLHEIISEKVYDDFAFIMEASVNANSYMPIYDFRDIPRYGRIPEIENVFGYLQVSQDGNMTAGTYQDNSLYQIWGIDGLICLSDHLLEQMSKV